MPPEQLSHFQIVSKLGEGGMGEVYRATDDRLGREVAIKILPAALTEDADRLARLEREARILASLNHPNIAGLHDIGHSDGVHFLVMELAAGQGLDERLARGPITRDDALKLAVQIARALEAAHELGIVHRDLKPSNVMVDDAGNVKLLDFGLAKALEDDPRSSGASLAHSPTLTAHATAAGMIMGTAAYMSPEQARGTPVDKRADVWAFGVLLYEMLAGRQIFKGGTISDILAAVLRADIEWDALPKETPRELRTVLRRSIVRDPDKRLRDIADVRIVLDEILEGGGEDDVAETAGAVAAASPDGRRPRLGWLALALAVGALATWGLLSLVGGRGPAETARSTPAASMHFRQLTLLPGDESQGAIAPDGESFLFTRVRNGPADIYLQRVDGQNAINLTESCAEADYAPAFSPDGRRIAFRSECSGGGIFIMGAMGESLRKVTDEGYDPAWSPDGTRLVVADEHPNAPSARSIRSRLWVVDIETGERTKITDHDAVGPAWSPDGRWIAFWGLPPTASYRDLYVVAADGSTGAIDDTIQLTDDAFLDWSPVWAPDSRSLLFSSTRGGTFNIWRLPFDPETGRRAGDPEPVTAPSSSVWHLSLAADGRRLIFTDRNINQRTWRARFDPASGGFTGPPIEVPMGSVIHGGFVEASPDGEFLVSATSGYPQHLYVVTKDGTGRRDLTQGLFRDRQGSWSPDGEWIAFQTDRFPGSAIGLIRADGSGLRPLGAPPFPAWYPRWSPDGKTMVVASNNGAFRMDPLADDPASTLEALPSPGEGLWFWPEGFSQDGRFVSGTIYRAAVRESIAVLALETGSYEFVEFGDRTGRAQFIEGGRYILADDSMGISVLDRNTGESRTLFEVTPGYRMVGFSTPVSSGWVSWIEAADESDIWLATFD